jgi:hypothetical protein
MDEITSAIGVLGVYVALMAVLSVGVEAVLDWIKIWGLKQKVSPSQVLDEIRGWLPEKESESWKARVEALNKSLEAIGNIELLNDATAKDIAVQIADKVREATEKHSEKERRRLGWIRLLALVFGVILAFAFQIDTLALLAPLSTTASDFWLRTVGPYWAHVLGIVLSGVAASAGSGFWHDQSARLRSLKQAAESAKTVAGRAS